LLIVALNGDVAALNKKDGSELWRTRISAGGWGTVTIAFDTEVVFACALSSPLFCLAYRTGDVLWQQATKVRYGRAALVVEDGLAYAARGGEVECFTREGVRLWRQGLKGMGVGATALGFPGNLIQADDTG
jgi:outer membrane protein assembly factor BamB